MFERCASTARNLLDRFQVATANLQSRLTAGSNPPDGDSNPCSHIAARFWPPRPPYRRRHGACELIRSNVDVIVTLGGPASEAAKAATSTVPVVMAAVGDAVGIGLVASLARPGGNLTGLTDATADLSGKRLQLLKEAVPNASRIAILWNENDPSMTLRYREIERAANLLHVAVQPHAVRGPEDFANAFAAMAQVRPDALFMVSDALFG